MSKPDILPLEYAGKDGPDTRVGPIPPMCRLGLYIYVIYSLIIVCKYGLCFLKIFTYFNQNFSNKKKDVPAPGEFPPCGPTNSTLAPSFTFPMFPISDVCLLLFLLGLFFGGFFRFVLRFSYWFLALEINKLLLIDLWRHSLLNNIFGKLLYLI